MIVNGFLVKSPETLLALGNQLWLEATESVAGWTDGKLIVVNEDGCVPLAVA